MLRHSLQARRCQPKEMPARRPLRSFCFAFFSGAENKLKSENVSFFFFSIFYGLCCWHFLFEPKLGYVSHFSAGVVPAIVLLLLLLLRLSSLLSLVLFHTARATLTMSEDEKSAIYKRCSWTQAEEKCRWNVPLRLPDIRSQGGAALGARKVKPSRAATALPGMNGSCVT